MLGKWMNEGSKGVVSAENGRHNEVAKEAENAAATCYYATSALFAETSLQAILALGIA